MHDQALRASLSRIAVDAIPDATDLWPAISERVPDLIERAPSRLGPRRVGLLIAAAMIAVVAWTFAGPSLTGRLSTAQAADIARHDPQVDAILRGDIALVAVTTVVNDTATVLVQDSRGEQVTVSVDLRSRIVTRVYQGPQLSATMTDRALAVVRRDPRTSALFGRGASVVEILPILVAYERASPAAGTPADGTETWAQVTLELDGQRWVARVDLPLNQIDQLLDPQGTEVPLP